MFPMNSDLGKVFWLTHWLHKTQSDHLPSSGAASGLVHSQAVYLGIAGLCDGHSCL